jgi:hypothetical protein
LTPGDDRDRRDGRHCSTWVNGEDVVVDGGIIRGRPFSPHQENLLPARAMLGLSGACPDLCSSAPLLPADAMDLVRRFSLGA